MRKSNVRKNKKPGDKKQREKQLSFEFKVLSHGKRQQSSQKKHLSIVKEQKPKRNKQRKQPVIRLLPKEEKELNLKPVFLSVKGEDRGTESLSELLKTPLVKSSSEKDLFFGNLITVEELAVVLGLAPQTIRNWVAQRKLPFVKFGRRNLFLKESLRRWLNQKEKPQWQ